MDLSKRMLWLLTILCLVVLSQAMVWACERPAEPNTPDPSAQVTDAKVMYGDLEAEYNSALGTLHKRVVTFVRTVLTVAKVLVRAIQTVVIAVGTMVVRVVVTFIVLVGQWVFHAVFPV